MIKSEKKIVKNGKIGF